MSLFAGAFGRQASAGLDVCTAVMIPMVAAAAADGRVSDDEVRQISSICAWSPIYARNSMDADTQIITDASRLVREWGTVPACAKAAEVLSPALRETAFAFAARIVFIDSIVDEAERQMLERLVSTLELNEGRARAIVDVIAVMQRSQDA